MWKDIPVPFYLSVHFFEVLNPEEVLQGAKPVLSQRGPYVYRSGTTCGPAWHHCAACWLAPLARGHQQPGESPALDFTVTQMCSDLAKDLVGPH